MQNLYEETKYIMKKYGIVANKKWGQNFLINQNVVNEMIEKSKISSEDLIIEIGPGLGTLTARLLEKASKVIVIELDERMLQILQDRFLMYKNFEIIHEDVLKVDLTQIIKENKQIGNIKKVKIVANLPYYITTPIIMKLLEEKLEIDSITVMIQKEVADRLTAIPGKENTGAITYSVYYYAQAEEILTVPNDSFIPEPEVNSEVITLKIRKNPPIKVQDEKKLFQIIKLAFMQRRKTLVNALTNSNLFRSKEEVEQILEKLEIDKKVRGEKLSLEQYAKIAENISIFTK